MNSNSTLRRFAYCVGAMILPFTMSSPLHANDYVFGPFVSRQINVGTNGLNVEGDEANTPTIAVDPSEPNRIVIGWRDIGDCYRRAGYAYSANGGTTWTNGGFVEPLADLSLPVVSCNALGLFYYQTFEVDTWNMRLFASPDGGANWTPLSNFASANREAWLVIDTHSETQTLYHNSGDRLFSSVDFGHTFYSIPVDFPVSAMAVASDGAVWLASHHQDVAILRDGVISSLPRFCTHGTIVTSDDYSLYFTNGKLWVGVDSNDPSFAAVLANTFSYDSGGHVSLSRTQDGGLTWDIPIRVDDSPVSTCPYPDGTTYVCSGAWQGAISIAPNGRIDVAWLFWVEGEDTHMRYQYSLDRGVTWSPSVQLTPSFDDGFTWADYCGDVAPHFYNELVSDNEGAWLAYAAPLNYSSGWWYPGYEWDVFLVRIPYEGDCNSNGIADNIDIESNSSYDIDTNGIPDECAVGWDHDGVPERFDPDDDNDGVSDFNDQCDQSPSGAAVDTLGRPITDRNDDCLTNLQDYFRFSDCLATGGPYDPVYAGCLTQYDWDPNGFIELRDFSVFQFSYGPFVDFEISCE